MLPTLLEHAAATGCDVEIILRPRDPRLPLVTAPLLHPYLFLRPLGRLILKELTGIGISQQYGTAISFQ